MKTQIEEMNKAGRFIFHLKFQTNMYTSACLYIENTHTFSYMEEFKTENRHP